MYLSCKADGEYKICDPACGTGGFLLAAHDYIAEHFKLDRAEKKLLQNGTLFGIELVDSVTRLCAMNLLLHGIGDDSGSGVPPLDNNTKRQDAVSTNDETTKRQDAASTESFPVTTLDALAGKHG